MTCNPRAHKFFECDSLTLFNRKNNFLFLGSVNRRHTIHFSEAHTINVMRELYTKMKGTQHMRLFRQCFFTWFFLTDLNFWSHPLDDGKTIHWGIRWITSIVFENNNGYFPIIRTLLFSFFHRKNSNFVWSRLERARCDFCPDWSNHFARTNKITHRDLKNLPGEIPTEQK